MESVRGSWWGPCTLNNPTEQDRQTIHGPAPRWLRMIKGQDEIGDNGTLHIQFVVNTRQIRMSQLKAWLPRAHFELARNENAVANYCAKGPTSVPDTQFEHNYVNENANKTMADIMLMIADAADQLSERTRERLAKQDEQGKIMYKPQEVFKLEYWDSVEMLLCEDENLVGLLTQPQYERAWVNTRKVWFIKLNLDRQTRISLVQEPPRNEIVNL